MKKLIIMRGIVGAGKSTKAKELANGYGVICSADNFFLKNGEYVFNPRFLKNAHDACKDKAAHYMKAKTDLVIIDNTNTQKWEYQPYLDMAKEFGYEVEIVMVGNLTDIDLYSSRNVHGVSKEVIERMARRFEL